MSPSFVSVPCHERDQRAVWRGFAATLRCKFVLRVVKRVFHAPDGILDMTSILLRLSLVSLFLIPGKITGCFAYSARCFIGRAL
jgi:hypothetical protein